MKIIKYYNEFINEEAISYNKVKPYLEIERSESVIQKLNEIFSKLSNLEGATTSKRGDRVYIPYKDDSDIEVDEVQLEIENVLNKKGYKISNYEKGLCVSEEGVTIKIGKLLNRLGYKDLLNKFNTDKAREGVKNKDVESYIVFSKHPYDIAGMSTGRGWTSCMDLYDKFTQKEYVKVDIKEGSIIAYLVSSDDLNINNPKARILAKPFVKEYSETHIVYFSEKIYGTTSEEFKKSVDDILDSVQENKIGIYSIQDDLYVDKIKRFLNLKNLKGDTKEEVEQILNGLQIENYTINDDLTVDVIGNVDISDLSLEKIIINFNNVSGDFDCSYNQLTTLKGAPKSVDGSFNCSDNKLTNLESVPKSVGIDFDCSENQLTSLDFSPLSVGRSYFYHSNKLTSLEGAPKSVSGDFSCSYNKLTSLLGGPQSVSGNFDCTRNQLTNLKGAPKSVDGSFNCSRNQLTTLEGAPKSVDSYFYCPNNQLTTLKGAPQSVGGDFNCFNNKLTDLIGAPKFVSGSFYCMNNLLLTLNGLPEKIDGRFDYNRNPVYNLLRLIEEIQYINTVVINNKLDLNKLNSILKEIRKYPVDGVEGYINI